MKKIYKYDVRMREEFVVMLPIGAEILSVQTQGSDGEPKMWVLVDPDANLETRRFRIFGTGHEIDAQLALQFIATFQVDDGHLVFHLFEAGP